MMIRGLYIGIMRRCTLCELCISIGSEADMGRFVVDGAESELGILDLIQVSAGTSERWLIEYNRSSWSH